MTLREDELALVRRLVLDRSAIQLEAGKEYLIESRLETLARQEGITDLSDMINEVRKSPSGSMAWKVIEAMTTNETSFFRDRIPFDTLRTTVLPELIKARSPFKKLTIWCGAASTGQEPYTIAMVLRDNFPELTQWDLTILATDISTEVLDRAKSAKYTQLEVNRGLPAELLVRHFDRTGTKWQVRPTIRDMVTFQQMNLAESWPHLPRPDIVFLRNVMIYFDVEVRRQILTKIDAIIARDGYLFLGAGETTLNLSNGFTRADMDRSGCFKVASRAQETSPLTKSTVPQHAPHTGSPRGATVTTFP